MKNVILNSEIPEEVLQQLTAKNRLCPMLSGAGFLRVKGAAGRLVVRARAEDIEVNAPAALLDLVMQFCDGTRTVEEVLQVAGNQGGSEEFADFVSFLIAEGALIDANLVGLHAVGYGFQFSPFGLAAPASITGRIGRRFVSGLSSGKAIPSAEIEQVNGAPLAKVFDDRVTNYTFGEKPIDVQTLMQFIWSLAGVVRANHPRVGPLVPQRTLGSAGGMHLLEVYLVLQRQVGRYIPGVYRAWYPGERQVHLDYIGDGQDGLILAFSKPWELTSTTGAIFVAADAAVAAMRYRSRSTQYLFMEAGAALHNGALSAPQLNLGFATIGGYYERAVSSLCRLENQLILGAAIFGAKATAEEEAMIARSPDIDFTWINGESVQYSMGFHLARATIVSDQDERPHTWGRDVDPRLAARKAIAESVEREGFREPKDVTMGCLAEIPGAMNPELFIHYETAQYDNPDFFYKPFSALKKYPWASATCLHSGKTVKVLAELVYSRSSLAARGFDAQYPFTQVTSSGCAASTTSSDATQRALFEVIERHAFMKHWLSQKPGSPVPLSQLPEYLLGRVDALLAVGCKVTIQHLPVPWARVALVSAQHGGLHFTTMGAAAAFSFTDALANALGEVEARVYAWIHGHRTTIVGPMEVQTPEHHFELYGLKKYFKYADRVLFPKIPPTEKLPDDLPFCSLDEFVAQLVSDNLYPVAIDITPTLCWIDQGRTKLSVTKALIPGLLPISFGYEQEALGMVKAVHPKSRFPHPFP